VKLVHGGGKIGDVLVDGASRAAGHSSVPAPPPIFLNINPMQGTRKLGINRELQIQFSEIYESLC
jgi:hypothetical protein